MLTHTRACTHIDASRPRTHSASGTWKHEAWIRVLKAFGGNERGIKALIQTCMIVVSYCEDEGKIK